MHIVNKLTFTVALAALAFGGFLEAQEPSARQLTQERTQAELDAPKLATVLELKPGMTVADIGAGGGAMTVVLGRWLGAGRVFATAPGLVHVRTIDNWPPGDKDPAYFLVLFRKP